MTPLSKLSEKLVQRSIQSRFHHLSEDTVSFLMDRFTFAIWRPVSKKQKRQTKNIECNATAISSHNRNNMMDVLLANLIYTTHIHTIECTILKVLKLSNVAPTQTACDFRHTNCLNK